MLLHETLILLVHLFMCNFLPVNYSKSTRPIKLLDALTTQPRITNSFHNSSNKIFLHDNSIKSSKRFHYKVHKRYPILTKHTLHFCFLDYNNCLRNITNNYSTANMSQTQTTTVVEPKSKVDTSVITLKADKPKEIFRKDYKPPDFIIYNTHLTFQLHYTDTIVSK